MLGKLAPHNAELAVALARLPEEFRGYGHVKERNVEAGKRKEAELLARFRAATPGGAKHIPIAVAV